MPIGLLNIKNCIEKENEQGYNIEKWTNAFLKKNMTFTFDTIVFRYS